MTRSNTRISTRVTRAIAALVVLAALLVGAPLALMAWRGNPWPAGGWAEIQLLTTSTIVGAFVTAGWLAWALMTVCILTETIAVVTGKTARRIPFVLPGQQEFARYLILSVAALGLGAGTMTNGAIAQPASASEATAQTVHAFAFTTPAAAPDEVEVDSRQGPSITLQTDTTAWRLAETRLGDGARWHEIRDLNHGIQLADGTTFTQGTQTLPAGTTLHLPADAQNLPTAAPNDDTPDTEAGGTDTTEHVAEDREGADHTAGNIEDAAPAETVTVVRGDTLWDISEEETGNPHRYKEVFEASKGTRQPGGEYLTDPDLIKPGWTITIPRDVPAADDQAPETADVAPELEEPAPTELTERPPTDPPSVEAPSEDAEESPAEAVDRVEQVDDTEENSTILGMPWALAGLTGAGTLLAGGLLIGLRQRRAAQFRARRPGRTIRPADPELAATERTITAAGPLGEEMLIFIDAALRRLAGTVHAAGSAMPPVAAVEARLGEDGSLTLHLSDTAELPEPWHGTPDRLHWHVPTATDIIDLGLLSEETDPPYPLLVTIGQADTGELWLFNCEEVGILNVTGDLNSGRNVVRHLIAQLAVNPWAQGVKVDCIGLGSEATPLGEGISYHAPGDQANAAIAETIADAIAMVDRATEYDIDVATGRTGQADDDLWPSRLLILDAASDEAADNELVGLDQLMGVVSHQIGRTATSILILGEHTDTAGTELRLTGTGRVVLEQAGLDLVGVSLTSEEVAGVGLVYAQSEILDDVEIGVDTTIDDGWETYADRTGGLRREHTTARATPPVELIEPATSLLDADDQDYLAEAAILAEDLEALAPRVPGHLRAEIEDQDPNLDEDCERWFADGDNCAQLILLGPVAAHTHGKALAKRRAYFTELLAFLWFHRRHGATRDQIVEAFGTPPDRVRKDISILRDWLGTNPDTKRPYLPAADEAPAAKTTGVNVYQLDDGVRVDWDLFKRLRVRADARGGSEGREDLMAALQLVTGRPCDRLREGGWSWLADGERHDHYMAAAIADVALTVTTHFLSEHDTRRAREATEVALLAAPDEEATRLSLVEITEAEGNRTEAQRILRDEVCNRSDDGQAPTDINDRTQTLINNRKWLAG
ncbi:hypothetical protein BSP109_02852 [Brevibacterium sp. Mu109]|uniref:LysM peptidoglycan-binding domain-containing protein n=1 Tax=Brevibacterium sp. Mu109 TaxID=1255669 RepID=UPI000C391EED|nr:LysM peptidoglycan-binding domain-containing protein [Brevibacterium sp. Mu109]SMX95228.1 hypothetical protein BSP109_02852 [Brevibacterium sp. Mu109]